MMTPGRHVATLLLDVGIALAAYAVIFWGIAIVRDALARQRWIAHQVTHDPADTEIWAVLSEARRITQEAADHDAG